LRGNSNSRVAQAIAADHSFAGRPNARYNFALDGQPLSLRFSIVNIFGTRAFDLNDAGAYNIHWNSGRCYGVRLIVDL